LSNQLLGNGKYKKPDEVVAWLGAVQSQDFAAAKWALGLRMRRATNADIEKAFNDGAILRTHVMRPTWHFVASQDIRPLLALTASRVHAALVDMECKPSDASRESRATLAYGRLFKHSIKAAPRPVGRSCLRVDAAPVCTICFARCLASGDQCVSVSRADHDMR